MGLGLGPALLAAAGMRGAGFCGGAKAVRSLYPEVRSRLWIAALTRAAVGIALLPFAWFWWGAADEVTWPVRSLPVVVLGPALGWGVVLWLQCRRARVSKAWHAVALSSLVIIDVLLTPVVVFVFLAVGGRELVPM